MDKFGVNIGVNWFWTTLNGIYQIILVTLCDLFESTVNFIGILKNMVYTSKILHKINLLKKLGFIKIFLARVGKDNWTDFI
jgi:hypothetical protein